ncbi:MAG: PKD domain-containing protein [Nitrospiraceae bacterium]|nr:MAG: PKD domain-containing protein [Nitrospiraceae bacterium]
MTDVSVETDGLARLAWTANEADQNVYALTFALPKANAGADQALTYHGRLVTLDGSGSSDPDGNYPLTYAWEMKSKPAGSSAALSNSETANPSFFPDLPGDYVFSLIVTDSIGLVGAADEVLISTYNTPPVADAGPDQVIVFIGTNVQLNGSTSYDDDGDDITYQWTMTSKPAGSLASLSAPASSMPNFGVDVYGDYVISLTVTDEYGAVSAANTVTISFANIKPVADAGGNQSVSAGSTVTLNGSGSDANNDPLTFLWSIVSKPAGSTAALSSADTAQTSLVADRAGNYIISLVVNDGSINSDPDNVTISATSSQGQLISTLNRLIDTINSLRPGDFKNPNMQNALTNKINAVLQLIDQGLYQDAYDKLTSDVLQKTDGCAAAGAPDRNDWIINCTAQGYPLVIEAIGLL